MAVLQLLPSPLSADASATFTAIADASVPDADVADASASVAATRRVRHRRCIRHLFCWCPPPRAPRVRPFCKHLRRHSTNTISTRSHSALQNSHSAAGDAQAKAAAVLFALLENVDLSFVTTDELQAVQTM